MNTLLLMLVLPVTVVVVCVMCLIVMIASLFRPRRDVDTFVFRRMRDDDFRI